MVPPRVGSSPKIADNTEDFPLPTGPVIANNSPARTFSVISHKVKASLEQLWFQEQHTLDIERNGYPERRSSFGLSGPFVIELPSNSEEISMEKSSRLLQFVIGRPFSIFSSTLEWLSSISNSLVRG